MQCDSIFKKQTVSINIHSHSLKKEVLYQKKNSKQQTNWGDQGKYFLLDWHIVKSLKVTY